MLTLLFVSTLYVLTYVVYDNFLKHMINVSRQSPRESHSKASESPTSLYNHTLPVNNPPYVGAGLEWRKHQSNCLWGD